MYISSYIFMNYMEMLQKAMKYESIDQVTDCCINITTEIMQYNFCFIDFETEDHLGVYYTADDFTERFILLKKEYIHSISIVYKQDMTIEENKLNDSGYI